MTVPVLQTNQPNYIGRSVPWEFLIADGTTDPRTRSDDFKILGSLNNKTFSLGAETSDNTTDDTLGVLSSLVTYLSFESSASGFATVEDGTLSNQTTFQRYFVDQTVASDVRRQPSLWVRITLPNLTYYAYVNVTSFNITAASTSTVEFETSVEATATNSDTIAPVFAVPTPSV